MTKAEQFYAAKEKLAAYDKETNYLILDAAELDVLHEEKYKLPVIVYKLRNAFKERITRFEVLGEKDLINPHEDWARGYCMISSYLIYSMTGGDKVWELHGTPLHWWLYHKKTQTRFDITHTQFDEKTLHAHYFNGKNIKYLNFDEMFYDGLKQKALILAHRAGLE